MKKRMIKALLLAVAVVGVLSLFPVSHAYGDYEWASGGAPGSGSGDGSGTVVGDHCKGQNYDSYYDCYCINRCPRWILVTKSVYDQIVSGNRTVGTYTSLPSCESDQYVIIAGDQDYNGEVQIYNQNSGNRVSPHKERHVYTSVAEGISSLSHTTDWGVTYNYNLNRWNDTGFLTWENVDGAVDEIDGHTLTYGEIIEKVETRSGFKEKDLAVICPSMVTETNSTVYFSSSNASATGVDTAHTGIQKEPYSVTTTTVNLTVGETLAEMSFSHDVYASQESEDTEWSVAKTGFLGYPFYSVGSYSGGAASGTTDITVPFSGHEEAKYSSVTSPQFTDKYQNIKFSVAGEYNFCETISVAGTTLTTACVKVNVAKKASSSYGSASQVSNRATSTANGGSSDYAKTDVYPMKGTTRSAETEKVSIKVGEEAAVTFSHNLYATKSTENVSWKITREVSGEVNGSGFNQSGYYTIKYDANGTPPYSANSAAAEVSGKANITQTEEEGLFVANKEDSRPYTDGSNRFVHRDFYRLTFNKTGTYKFCEYVYVEGTLYTWVCSTIEVKSGGGDPDPEIPDCNSLSWFSTSDGITSVASAVQNITIGTGWDKEVYAKPNDDVEWIHCYYPGVQTRYDEIVTRFHYSHSTYDSYGTHPNTNVQISSFGTWQNRFTVSASNFTSKNGIGSKTNNYVTGDSSMKSLEDPYAIQTGSNSKAGKTLTEKITSGSPTSISVTNYGDHTWTCDPYDCSYTEPYSCGTEAEPKTCYRVVPKTCYRGGCTHGNSYIASSRGGTATDKASVLVPYNFINTASIALKETAVQGESGTRRIVYAGETATVDKATINVETRYNAVTDGTYATRVNGAEVRMLAYTSNSGTGSAVAGYGTYGSDLCSAISGITHGNCTTDAYYGPGRSGYLNYVENTSGTTEYKFQNGLYNVYDVPAGEYYCVVAAVYPYTVSSDTDMNSYGSDSWYISAPDCYIIAKKPSLQVFGGSLYTAKNVITNVTAKNVIDGFYGYSSTNRSNRTIFGSWVEQAVIVPTGRTAGLASGAATGYYSSNGNTRTPSAGLGGSKEGTSVNYCNRIPLTISNSNCTSSMQQAGGYGSYGTPKPTDKAALIERFTGGDDEGINYIAAGDYNLSTTTIPKGETRVISSTGTVTISGNVVYADSYTKLSDVPKLIIYAKNITINCDVSRVDAVLIAENNVNTCPSTSYDARENSNQLKINGVVIANTLTANRTYGAATGANSIVPAEIIDYDTTLYLWGNSQADADESGRLNITYQHELSPRY